MALAPYWLSPTLCPFPVPVMTKFPLEAPPPEGCTASAETVTVPEAVMAEAVFPHSVPVVPLPEITETPSREESSSVPLTESPPELPRRPLMSKRRLLTDF